MVINNKQHLQNDLDKLVKCSEKMADVIPLFHRTRELGYELYHWRYCPNSPWAR